MIKNTMQTNSELEKAIRDRLETGFKNRNGGYDGWLEWCNTLYEPDAHYNIPFKGSQKRCTLEEYKAMMGQLFQHFYRGDVSVSEYFLQVLRRNI